MDDDANEICHWFQLDFATLVDNRDEWDLESECLSIAYHSWASGVTNPEPGDIIRSLTPDSRVSVNNLEPGDIDPQTSPEASHQRPGWVWPSQNSQTSLETPH